VSSPPAAPSALGRRRARADRHGRRQPWGGLTPARLPRSIYALSAAVVLDLSADAFVLFTLLWVAGPQGWTGVQTAAIVIALRLPALFGGVLGGRAIDRYGPKPLMVAGAALRIACLTGLTVCSWSGHYPLGAVLALGGLSGAVVPIGYAGARTVVPRLVPPAEFIRANALLAVGDQVSLLVGAALVGPLLATIGAGPALLAPIGMLAVASILFTSLPRPAARGTDAGAEGADRDSRAMATDHGGGAAGAERSPRAVDAGVDPRPATGTGRSKRASRRGSPWRLRPVLGLVTLSVLYYFAYGPFEPVLPYFTRQHLHAGTGTYSLLWVTFGLGALVGLSQAKRLSRYPPGIVNAAGTALWGLVTLPLVFCTSAVPALVIMTLSGVVWGPYLAVESTALQRWTAPSLHGRLFGTQHAILAVAGPLGAAAGSLALLEFPSAQILAASTLACIVAGLAALSSGAIRQPAPSVGSRGRCGGVGDAHQQVALDARHKQAPAAARVSGRRRPGGRRR
jgi:predicted MFS family arabinose efflux permease